MIRLIRRRLPLMLTAVSLVVAGCVNLPSGGTLRNVNSLRNSDRGSQFVITPRAPGPQWQPKDIVSGFLVASGANPNDLSIAREYLTKRYARKWHPSSSPQVIDTGSKVVPTEVPTRLTGGQGSDQVTVTSQHLESLVAAGANEAGRLQVAPEPAPYAFRFELVQVAGGKWRIDSIIEPNGKASDSILLLTDSDFERDYLPRNLYYLAKGSPRTQTLLPYPVYIPAQTGQSGGVQQLVEAVRMLPPTRSNWLYQAIATAFPPGTKVTAQVEGSNAIVSLGGKAARASGAALRQMEAQLVWTLTSAPDSPGGTGINSVELRVGDRSVPNLLPLQFMSWVPRGPSGPLYFQPFDQVSRPHLEAFTPRGNFGPPDTGAAAGTHSVAGGNRSPVLLASGLGGGPFTSVAISPAQADGVNYFAGCRGKQAYVAPLVIDPVLESGDLPGNCTSLSWDNQGDVWAVAGSDVYVLNALPSVLHIIPVSIPAQQIAQPDSFVSLKVAPDGLRVAMIVRGQNGASVYVSAITKKAKNSSIVYLAQGGLLLTAGPDLVNPIALAWWDSNHLLVLDRLHGVSQLYEVPLNGGESTKVATPPNAVSVTANGSLIAVGTPAAGSQDQPTVLAARGLDGGWVPVDAGSTPTYVG